MKPAPITPRSTSVLIAAAVVATAIAALAAVSAPRTARAEGSDPKSPQEVARETIVAKKAFAHVRFLASDELGGRDTPSAGLDIAARYIAAQFESWGLEPVGDGGTFFQAFNLQAITPAATSAFSWRSATEGGGQGKVALASEGASPFAFGADGSVNAPIVFAGYGITAPDQGYDDYAGIDVTGKVVLILRYAPREKDPACFFSTEEGRRHAFFQTKYRNALDHGAAALLVVTGPLHHDADNFITEWPAVGGLPGGGRGRGGEGIPAVHVAQATADRILASGGSDGLAALKAWQTGIDEAMKPASKPLGVHAAVELKLERKGLPTKNVVAAIRGTDPAHKDEVIVVGGHYDHVGIGGAGADRIHNGADDNASGTAGVLEIAQAFALSPQKPRRTVVFMAFAGEEKGLLGSEHYVRNPIFPLEKTVAMVNLDMIGRNAPLDVEVLGAFDNPDIKALAERANATVGMKLAMPKDIEGGSDHMPFLARGVPAVFFFTGFHPQYHQPADHSDLIVAEKLERVSRLAFNCAWELAMGDAWPRRPTPERPAARPTPTPAPATPTRPRNPKAKVY